MSRPVRSPDRGDVLPAMAAQRLGLLIDEFERVRPQLEQRGFPEPDPTTGRYCVEAVDKWRLRRFPFVLFKSLKRRHLSARRARDHSGA